jgi:hypothetical protein
MNICPECSTKGVCIQCRDCPNQLTMGICTVLLPNCWHTCVHFLRIADRLIHSSTIGTSTGHALGLCSKCHSSFLLKDMHHILGLFVCKTCYPEGYKYVG